MLLRVLVEARATMAGDVMDMLGVEARIEALIYLRLGLTTVLSSTDNTMLSFARSMRDSSCQSAFTTYLRDAEDEVLLSRSLVDLASGLAILRSPNTTEVWMEAEGNLLNRPQDRH